MNVKGSLTGAYDLEWRNWELEVQVRNSNAYEGPHLAKELWRLLVGFCRTYSNDDAMGTNAVCMTTNGLLDLAFAVSGALERP